MTTGGDYLIAICYRARRALRYFMPTLYTLSPTSARTTRGIGTPPPFAIAAAAPRIRARCPSLIETIIKDSSHFLRRSVPEVTTKNYVTRRFPGLCKGAPPAQAGVPLLSQLLRKLTGNHAPFNRDRRSERTTGYILLTDEERIAALAIGDYSLALISGSHLVRNGINKSLRHFYET